MSALKGQVIDRSTKCLDSACPQRAACALYALTYQRGMHMYAMSLRPRWACDNTACQHFKLKEQGNADG